jgi:precorrin-3B synthase
MQSGDGLVVRVRPRGGRLSQEEAAGIAELAAAHGNGLIDLTSRANVQVRGVTEASFGLLLAGLELLGLTDATSEAEARRNIVVTPFWSGDDGTLRIAAALADALARPDAPEIPGKFGFAVDCGSSPVLSDTPADIRIERSADGGLICRADGATAGRRVTEATAADAAMALSRWFIASGGRGGGDEGGRGRMVAHLGHRARLPAAYLEVAAQLRSTCVPVPGAVPSGFLAGFEFGQLRGATLATLARLGALRVTPWRMLLIEGEQLAPDVPGLITTAGDPMSRIVACTGMPGCLQALQPTRELARALAPHVPGGALLHVSGCAKGCAHPAAASMTLTAVPDGFDFIRHGRANGPAYRQSLTASALRAHPEILTEAL